MVLRSTVMNNGFGTVTLIGSGEFGEGMGRTYRAVLARAPSNPTAVFLDTPAGFELNADAIAERAVQYFAQHLNVTLEHAGFKNRNTATASELEAALHLLRRADLIFAGPGSPSYAIHHLRGTPIWEAVLDRYEHGAHLIFASAAAIAISASALPVYEIYKVGADPHWIEGLDLMARQGLKLAVVPHWNNAEGGTYDTRYCFMGESRFQQLESQLPADTVVLGIDEHTACLLDLSREQFRVMGAGNVTVRCNGSERVHPSGTDLPTTTLLPAESKPTFPRSTPRPQTLPREGVRALAELFEEVNAAPDLPTRRKLLEQVHLKLHALAGQPSADETTRYLVYLAHALDETDDPEHKRVLIERAHEAMHEMDSSGTGDGHTGTEEEIGPYIELLIAVRRQLREQKQYELADFIRQELAELKTELQDTDSGTSWRKM